ncbi:MAG: DUF1501 domain-containing protein [Bacteroidota bacterium]
MPHNMDKLFTELDRLYHRHNTRRHFLRHCSTGLGMAALSTLVGCDFAPAPAQLGAKSSPIAKAKRVIFLHMAGAPSQLELFDYKPELAKLDGQDCPPSLLAGKRFAFIEGVPKMLGPQALFKQRGQSGAWISDLLPHLAQQADELTILKACHTDQFNHAPAQLLLHTGSAQLGRSGLGSWISYGLGSENDNLPAFVVLVSGGAKPSAGKSLWGSGFLPTVHQGVQCRGKGDPVLYVSDPHGMPRDLRGRTIEAINRLNEEQYQEVGDPEILTRIQQYEMAYRMQVSVPKVMDITDEPAYIHQLYGSEPGKASFANNCLLARKLVENGVRFVQLFDWGWDMHGTAADVSLGEAGLVMKCRETDRPISALIIDLKQRGLLEDTLIVWGGEFGRTPMQENREGLTNPYKGRDHHTEAFTVWMAGAGCRAGYIHGETDEIGFYGVEGRVHVHDLQATLLHQLGIDHEELTYPFQGRDFRLTDVSGKLINEVLA